MFWNKKNKSDKQKKGKSPKGKPIKGKKAEGKEQSQSLTSEELRTQALANAKAARERIGEETLDKIAAMMEKKQKSAMEQAKRQIQSADSDKVIDELKWMMDKKN